MDRGAWKAAVHGVAEGRTRLRDFTFTFTHWRRRWQPTPVFLLENPRDGGAWWAAVSGVARSRTRLKPRQQYFLKYFLGDFNGESVTPLLLGFFNFDHQLAAAVPLVNLQDIPRLHPRPAEPETPVIGGLPVIFTLFEVRTPLRCALRFLLQIFVPSALSTRGLCLKIGQFERRN